MNLPTTRWSVFALITGLAISGRMFAQCAPGDILVGEDEDHYYCIKKADYVGSPAERDGKAYHLAHLRVKATEAALKQIGFDVDTERYALYSNVSQEQIKDLQRKLVSGLIDGCLDSSVFGADGLKSLNPWNVNNTIHELESYHGDFQPIIDALRGVAATSGKPEMAEAYKNFTELVKASKQGYLSGQAAAEDPNNRKLIFLLGALKTLQQKNPEAAWGVSAAELVENGAYLAYLTHQVNALGAATDDKLKMVTALSLRLKNEVKETNDIRDRWRTETGFKTATPIWNPSS